MKHLYGFIIAILPVIAHEQDVAFRKHLEVGAFGGSQLLGKIYDARKMDHVSGWIVGADAAYRFREDRSGISLHLQPNFSTFKFVWESEKNIDAHYRYRWKWEAVNVPLTVRYTLGNARVRPFAEAGLNLRLRMRLSLNHEFISCGFCSGRPGSGTTDLQNAITRDPAGVVAAIGAEIDLHSVTIPVTVRFMEGFGTYDLKPDPALGGSYGALKTRVVQVTAGIGIP